MFAIIDVETTGLNPAGDRITEIAVYLHNGHKITDEYQTLVNPEKRISHQITGLTGISNRMVVVSVPDVSAVHWNEYRDDHF